MMKARAFAVVALFSLGACSKSEIDTPIAPGGGPVSMAAGDERGAHAMAGMGPGMPMQMLDGGMVDAGVMNDAAMDHPMPGRP